MKRKRKVVKQGIKKDVKEIESLKRKRKYVFKLFFILFNYLILLILYYFSLSVFELDDDISVTKSLSRDKKRRYARLP